MSKVVPSSTSMLTPGFIEDICISEIRQSRNIRTNIWYWRTCLFHKTKRAFTASIKSLSIPSSKKLKKVNNFEAVEVSCKIEKVIQW